MWEFNEAIWADVSVAVTYQDACVFFPLGERVDIEGYEQSVEEVVC